MRSGRTGGQEKRESDQEEETDMVKRIYSGNNGRDPLAGEGSEAWLLSLCNNTVNDTFITFHSCNSHIQSYTLLYSLAQTLDRWPCTLAAVSNEMHAYVKNQQHFTALSSEWQKLPVSLDPRCQNATTATEPGKESKPLLTASHLHNNGRRLSP